MGLLLMILLFMITIVISRDLLNLFMRSDNKILGNSLRSGYTLMILIALGCAYVLGYPSYAYVMLSGFVVSSMYSIIEMIQIKRRSDVSPR